MAWRLLLTRLVLAASGPAVLPEGCHVLRGRVHRPLGGSPCMTNGDFRIRGQSHGDLEYEPWKDGVNGGYRFDMAALNPQWPALRVSDADRDEVIKVLREGSADGRLSLDTFLHRMELALQARDAGQLASLLSDLRPAARRASVAGRAATRWQEFAGQLRDA